MQIRLPRRLRRGRFHVGLGLLTAIGGLLDVGNLVANPQAGARYGFLLIPVIVGSGVIVAVFAEMAGRVAAVANIYGFEVVTEALPRRVAQINLAATLVLTIMTCTAEIGGVATILAYWSGVPLSVWTVPTAGALALAVWRLRFHLADEAFGLAGLTLLVTVAALAAAGPRWHDIVSAGADPLAGNIANFTYLAVAQVGSMIVPYQLFFFSSGVREERSSLSQVRMNARAGYLIGTGLAAVLTALAATVKVRTGVQIDTLATVISLPSRFGLGRASRVAMSVGMFVAMTGAAFETALATGYIAAQYRGWPWGMNRDPRSARRFYTVTLGTLAVAGSIMAARVNVSALTDYSLVLSTVALPITYYPLFRIATDRRRMGERVAGRAFQVGGAMAVILVCVVALGALPALVLGSG